MKAFSLTLLILRMVHGGLLHSSDQYGPQYAYHDNSSPGHQEGYRYDAPGGRGEHNHGHEEQPKPYQFQYAVQDPNSGNDFSRQESSNGDTVQGEYRVLLPDGRTQIVTYTADWQTGYRAQVRYEGEAIVTESNPFVNPVSSTRGSVGGNYLPPPIHQARTHATHTTHPKSSARTNTGSFGSRSAPIHGRSNVGQSRGYQMFPGAPMRTAGHSGFGFNDHSSEIPSRLPVPEGYLPPPPRNHEGHSPSHAGSHFGGHESHSSGHESHSSGRRFEGNRHINAFPSMGFGGGYNYPTSPAPSSFSQGYEGYPYQQYDQSFATSMYQPYGSY